MIRVWCVVVIVVHSCSAVIYHLNDSEYQRMPPLVSLDEYESCLVEEGSAYCMLQLHLYAEPGNQLMRMITEYSEHRIKHYNHSVIERGICVRRSCGKYASSARTNSELTRALEACVSAGLQRAHGLSARAAALLYCEGPYAPLHRDSWDDAVLVLVLALVSINIAGSLYDYILSKGSEEIEKGGNLLLLSFSLVRNWKWLTYTETSDPKTQSLQFVHGARVISNIFIVLAHVMIVYASGFTNNSHDFERSFERPLYLLIFNGMMIVQIFFFISGFLTVFKLRLEEETRCFTAWDIPKIIALRFSRLVPALAMTLALSTTWVRHAGSGPLWNLFITSSLVADCRTYWWHTLLFINNYMPDNRYCLIPTWHLAADMQVFLVGVTAFILTRGRTRRMILAALLLLSAAAPAVHTLLQDLDAVTISPEFYRTLIGPTFRLQHILGHNNLPCFIMGMATGSWLYGWQKNGTHLMESKVFRWLQYVSVAGIPLVLYLGSVFYADAPRASPLTRAAYSSAIRILVGLVCAMVFPAFFTNTPSFLKAVFEWRSWVVPSRLTYCVFLLHMVLIHMLMGSRTQLTHFSGFNLLCAHFCTVLVSYLISVPFYLMVEAPFSALCKGLARKPSLSQSNGSHTNLPKKKKTL